MNFIVMILLWQHILYLCIARAERDGTRAETRFRLSPKRTSPFKSVGESVQSTAGSRGGRIGFSNTGYTTFGGGVRLMATHSIRQFPLHFPSCASPCTTRFRTSSTLFLVQAIASPLASLHEKQRKQIQDMLPKQYHKEKVHIFNT